MGYSFLLQLLLCAAVFGPLRVQAQATELSCSIMLWGNQDYEWTTTRSNGVTRYNSRCIRSVQRARERCGGKGLNFVPTHFWKGTNSFAEPIHYCYKVNRGSDQETFICHDMDTKNKTGSDNLINQYQTGFKECVKEALRLGFNKIKVTPHVSDGARRGGWRNTLGVDPFKKHNGYSYWDTMLRPSAIAIRDALSERNAGGSTTVLFTLQGEMNYCLAAYPRNWMTALTESKKLLGPTSSRRKYGVSLNFNKLCGDYCSSNPTRTGTNERLNITAYGSLLSQMDFMGISHYPSMFATSQSGRWDFTGPIQTLSGEMRQVFRINLVDLVRNKEFHLSEFGIGGGAGGAGRGPLPANLQQLADLTFFGYHGIAGQFDMPWSIKWIGDFRFEFYRRAIRWLSNRSNHGSIKIDGAFLWCMSSWDFPGLYWTSYGKNNATWYAPRLTAMVKRYNDQREVPAVG